MNTTYIFIHIPKTAGTTLRYHFQKHLVDQKSFIHLANKGNKQAESLGMKPFHQRSADERRKAKVILGHNVTKETKQLVKPNKVCEVVFFRNPNDWTISRYNQYANARSLRDEPYLKFNEWLNFEKLQSQFDWFLVHYLGLEISGMNANEKYQVVLKGLKNIQIVGIVESIDLIMENINNNLDISQEMKRENVTGQNRKKDLFIKSSENLSSLKDLNTSDTEFYENIINNLTDNIVQ